MFHSIRQMSPPILGEKLAETPGFPGESIDPGGRDIGFAARNPSLSILDTYR
ncbi:hypothetical protein RTCIAT899_PA00025 (plasmid) [Rhizobium tropici CIAT 899]|nr:hypothetical protein RTCIAT899_PA00025 [Rhizobium tropici CIAT 899]